MSTIALEGCAQEVLLPRSGSLLPTGQNATGGQSRRNQGKNQEQERGQDEVLEPRREIASMPDCKDADVVGRWRGQDKFRDQIGLQESSPEENHSRRDDEPRGRDPLHRIDHLVIERKVIDEEDWNSGARIEDKWRASRPAVDADLVDAEGKKISPEQSFSLRFGFAVSGHGSGRGIIVRRAISIHDGISVLTNGLPRHGPNSMCAGTVIEFASSKILSHVQKNPHRQSRGNRRTDRASLPRDGHYFRCCF